MLEQNRRRVLKAMYPNLVVQSRFEMPNHFPYASKAILPPRQTKKLFE